MWRSRNPKLAKPFYNRSVLTWPTPIWVNNSLLSNQHDLHVWKVANFLSCQNGATAEAMRIWKSNFDKEFEGNEECPICYSIIHTTNHSLPRLACKTCKHKFHSACLYKWFSTSHKSTCPLCQTPFWRDSSVLCFNLKTARCLFNSCWQHVRIIDTMVPWFRHAISNWTDGPFSLEETDWLPLNHSRRRQELPLHLFLLFSLMYE